MDVQRRKSRVAWLSVISNSSLVVGKLAVGLLIGSVAVVSEAIHSGVDLLASVIALVAVQKAGVPADQEHPFGHGKIENISGAVEALLIFVAAGWIVVEAIRKLLHPTPLEQVNLGIVVMLLSALVNLVVSHMLFKVAKETDSVALQADGWHLRTDVYTSAGVMAGLALIALGRRTSGVELAWLDPLAAIIVALLIVRAAYRLTLESTRDLLDVRLPEREESWIRGYIASLAPAACGYHHLRTRKAGGMRFIEFHLMVAAEMSVDDAHRLSEEIDARIEAQFPGASVVVHIEPCNGIEGCPPGCKDGCLRREERRAAMPGGR